MFRVAVKCRFRGKNGGKSLVQRSQGPVKWGKKLDLLVKNMTEQKSLVIFLTKGQVSLDLSCRPTPGQAVRAVRLASHAMPLREPLRPLIASSPAVVAHVVAHFKVFSWCAGALVCWCGVCTPCVSSCCNINKNILSQTTLRSTHSPLKGHLPPPVGLLLKMLLHALT